jgi:plastocyanin
MTKSARRWFGGGAVGLVVAGALLLSACDGGAASDGTGAAPTSSGASGAAKQANSITISNFMFAPMSASVAPGTTVRVTNKDSVDHTLTATGGQFDTGDIGDGQTKTFTAPTKPGTYHYICNIHQYMMGIIVVR